MLAALARSTVRPARTLAVDTGSRDAGPGLLAAATDQLLALPRGTSYAAAVSAALRRAPDTTWVWLLHDDSAPEPEALAQLLAATAGGAALVGPALVDADDPRRLLELGVSSSLDGRRDGLLEPGELDQGQYDRPRPVLAVSTAGALVRRETLEQAGGLDPAAGTRADLDLGWRLRAAGAQVLAVPTARVRHVAAATTGSRPVPRLLAADRRAAHRLLAARSPWLLLPVLLPRLLLGSLLRAVVALLSRRPEEALAHLTALTGLPAGLLVRRAGGVLSWRAARPLLAPARRTPLLRRPAVRLRRRRSELVLLALLTVVALVACRDLLGVGRLAGGALLPAPPAAADLWRAWGGTARGDLLVLSLGATGLLGAAGLLVDLLVLGAVPLSGGVALLVARRCVRGRLLPLWAAATWALLPAATGALAAGRLGLLVAHAALPALLLAGWRLVRGARWSVGWALGLALAAVAGLEPLVWPVVAVPLLGTALVAGGLGRAAVATAVPALLVLPGSGALPTSADRPATEAWRLLLLDPAGPGTPAAPLAAALLLAALVALLRPRTARVTAGGWGLALLGLGVAVAADRSGAHPGAALDLAAAGLLLAVLAGADGASVDLRRTVLGSRQAALALVAVAALVLPLVWAGAWLVRGVAGPLVRQDRPLLPAFAQAELARSGREVLVLGRREDGTVTAVLSGPAGPRLDRPGRAPSPPVVQDLLTGGSGAAAVELAGLGAGFVVLQRPDDALQAALDASPGLDRRAAADPPLWQLSAPGGPPPPTDRAPRWLVAVQGLALAGVAVLAGPGRPPLHGLVRRHDGWRAG